MSERVSALVVRPARPEEAERLAEIQARAVRACGREFYAAAVIEAWAWGSEKLAACRGWIGEAGVQVSVCERAGSVLGFAVYVAKADSIYVHSLYCDPDAIGRGIGRTLLAAVEAFALNRATHRVTVQSSLNAVGFYDALGFIRLRDGFQEIGRDRLRWEYVAMGKMLSA